MTQSWNNTRFKKSCLASMLAALLSPSVYALESLSDDHLSDTTGEGIALLPENFKMVFQGPNDLSTASSYNNNAIAAADKPKYDTGFIRIIPVGENYSGTTATDLTTKQTKADIFIYGLALSKTNNNANSRFSNTTFNWGSTANPWLLRAGSQTAVPQFLTTGNISYLALEAPLAKVTADSTEDKIKLGFWIDAFSRKWASNNLINSVTGAPVANSTDATNVDDNDLSKSQRLRLQVVANGLSINGSQVRLFQTLTSGVTQYNQTLGMAAILRLNTNSSPQSLVFDNTAANKTALDANVLRMSTAASDDGVGVTPALFAGRLAPLFDSNEGLYLYSPNINLVLGNMYQPFIVGSEGRNIVLEVTAIPKVANVYKKIYTDYSLAYSSVGDSSDYKGSTCNVYVCGYNTSQVLANGSTVNYQGNNATHSSISIGTVKYDATKNLLNANPAANPATTQSTGVVFRTAGASSTAVNLGSAAIDGLLIQHLKFKTTGL